MTCYMTNSSEALAHATSMNPMEVKVKGMGTGKKSTPSAQHQQHCWQKIPASVNEVIFLEPINFNEFPKTPELNIIWMSIF